MSALTPVAESFRAVRHHLVTVTVITVAVAALILVNSLIGILAVLIITPMLIDLTVGKRKSAKSAFTGSRDRILRYLLWRFAVTVAGLAVVGTSLALVLFTFYKQYEAIGFNGLASGQVDIPWALWSILLLLLSGAAGLVTGVVGDMLAVSAAAGYRDVWSAVRKVFAKGRRAANVTSLAVVYAMVFAAIFLNSIAFGMFALKDRLLNAPVSTFAPPEVADRVLSVADSLAESLPPTWVLWVIMVVVAITASFVSSIMRPVMLAQIVRDAAGEPELAVAVTRENVSS